jgi:hypothetical protein
MDAQRRPRDLELSRARLREIQELWYSMLTENEKPVTADLAGILIQLAGVGALSLNDGKATYFQLAIACLLVAQGFGEPTRPTGEDPHRLLN